MEENILTEEEKRETAMMRALSRQRAEYIYYILKGAKDMGIDYHEFARKGLIEQGVLRAERLVKGKTFKTVKDFFDAAAPEKMRKAFMMRGEYIGDKLQVHCGYCPLVEAWENLGLPADEVRDLCEVIMSGDMQSYNSMPGIHCEWIHSLAHGDGECMFEYTMRDEPDGDIDPGEVIKPKQDRPCEAKRPEW